MGDKITYGRFFMKSGNVIEFAAKKLEWTKTMAGFSEVDYHFVPIEELEIPCIDAMIWTEVEAIVTDGEIEQ